MKALEGTCPNEKCKNQIYFLKNVAGTIECIKCKHHHAENTLLNVKPVSSSVIEFLQNLQKSKDEQIKRKMEAERIKGLSNYCCKLISPLLTKYGLDKNTQEVKLLRTMGQGETFDCSHLCNRAFMIEPENLLIPEYGRDNSVEYLKDTLKEISNVNGSEERLVPIYVDGDGHCLLHAISRALVGRELFWHPLLTNLKGHFTKHQSDYKAFLGDFIQDSEWNDIIKEADPNYLPAYGETHGLRNIHIFGLANVLHRPIILIDSLEGMKSKGDYSAIFLPALIPVEKCKSTDGSLNKPVVIAWSSKGHNHFVPLVGIKGKPIPKYPFLVLPKVWGISQDLLYNYIEFQDSVCVIGGAKTLSETYLKRLIDAMSKHYQILYGVAPSIVTDCYQYIYKPSGVVGMTAQMVTEASHALVKDERLYRCLNCSIVEQKELPCPLTWLEPGGKLYDIALKTHGTLKNGYQYKFPYNNNIICSYDQSKNKLLLVQDYSTLRCKQCEGSMRLVKRDGSTVYLNGDQLPFPASSTSHCGCGFKHFWDGKQYDNLPKKIPVTLEWNGQKKEDIVFWFQNESDPSNNSNAFELSQKIVQKHFPGEFGSERVVQKVVEQIFRETTKHEKLLEEKSKLSAAAAMETGDSSIDPPCSKIILTGAKSKTIHKEELNASKTEQILRKKIQHGASLKQNRSSASPVKQTKIDTSPSKVSIEDAYQSKEGIESNSSDQNNKIQRKVRICTTDQRSVTYSLTDNTSFNDIQCFVEENFNIRKELQTIKYGFPPKLLEPEKDASSPLDLKHGERLVVHIKKIRADTPMEVDLQSGNSANTITTGKADQAFSTNDNNQNESRTNDNNKEDYFSIADISRIAWDKLNLPNSPTKQSSSKEPRNNAGDAATLLSLLEKVDLWAWAKRSMFQPKGLYYVQAFRDLKDIDDNKHFSLPYFPNKLFAYNKEADEIYLCLGKTHIPVQALTPEQEQLASKQVLDAQIQKLSGVHKRGREEEIGDSSVEQSKNDIKQGMTSVTNEQTNVLGNNDNFTLDSIPPLILPVPPIGVMGNNSKTANHDNQSRELSRKSDLTERHSSVQSNSSEAKNDVHENVPNI